LQIFSGLVSKDGIGSAPYFGAIKSAADIVFSPLFNERSRSGDGGFLKAGVDRWWHGLALLAEVSLDEPRYGFFQANCSPLGAVGEYDSSPVNAPTHT